MDGTVECRGPRGVRAAGARRWLSNHIWRILLGRERSHAESEAQQGRVHSYTPSLPLQCLTEAPVTPNMKLVRKTAMEALQNSSTASQALALPFVHPPQPYPGSHRSPAWHPGSPCTHPALCQELVAPRCQPRGQPAWAAR